MWWNGFDLQLRWAALRGVGSVLVAWNRGLGDIALGLYPLVERIREALPTAEITFLVREGLCDGMSMVAGVKVIGAPWKRNEPYHVGATLERLGLDERRYDWVIAWPNPTRWLGDQRGKIVPRLVWNPAHDALWRRFGLEERYTYIGIQPVAETNYGLWRNWPLERWQELIALLEKRGDVRLLLFGYGQEPLFKSPIIQDLRGKTSLFELLSIAQYLCRALVLPDSGILSMLYYLDVRVPMRLISLWADTNQGILKQNVASPNPLLVHKPLVGGLRNLGTISAEEVVRALS